MQASFMQYDSLWASCWGALAAGRKSKESLQLHLWNLNSTSSFPVAPNQLSCQISANEHEAVKSTHVNKHCKKHAKGNDIITNVISANKHFASTFLMQIFKFQRHCWKLSLLFPSRRQSNPESLLAGWKYDWFSNIRLCSIVFDWQNFGVSLIMFDQRTQLESSERLEFDYQMFHWLWI